MALLGMTYPPTVLPTECIFFGRTDGRTDGTLKCGMAMPGIAVRRDIRG